MFTGIVEELGTVRGVHPIGGGARIEIAAMHVLVDTMIGGSIAVNGCCLTVVELGEGGFAADAVTETLARTTIGELRPGNLVNLERPVRLEDRLGGHLVQGHVDAVGTIRRRDANADGSQRVEFGAPDDILRYVVEKGSVTVDGVSLTVAEVLDDGFAVAVIPHTLAVTTLGSKRDGAPVNLEVDIVAKYVERLLPKEGASVSGRGVGGRSERPQEAG
jgi:riboflavin synthase